MYAVITAGGPIDGEFARAAGTASRRWRRCAAGRCSRVRSTRCARAGSTHRGRRQRRGSGRMHTVNAGKMIADAGSGAANVRGALDAWPDEAPLLYLTCDMPYIDCAPQWFLDRIDRHTLSMPLCEHAGFVERFPGAPAFGIAFAGERVVNGGVFHFPAGSRARVRTLATTISTHAKRRGRWRASRDRWCSRFVLGRLSVSALEARAQRVFGLPVTALRNAPAELAYDVDTSPDTPTQSIISRSQSPRGSPRSGLAFS